MSLCVSCQQPTRTERLPYHDEDLGGIKVRLINSVEREVCGSCGESGITIKDLPGLIRAVAIARITSDLKLNGKEIRFLRKVIDLSAKDMANKLNVTPETISRWENGREPIGNPVEKLLRMLVGLQIDCSVEKDQFGGEAVNEITNMQIRSVRRKADEALMCFELRPREPDGRGWSVTPARDAA